MTRDDQCHHFEPGDYVSFVRRFTANDLAAFAELSGDRNPLHHDAPYAAANGFGRPIVPLQLAAAPLSAIAGMMLPGRPSLVLDSQVRALQPVPYDEPVEYSAKVAARHEAGRVLSLRVIAFQRRTVLLDARLNVRVRDDSEDDSPRPDVPPVCKASEEHVALVTGATGAIGGAVCRLLADKGWKLVALVREGSKIAAFERECRKSGVELIPLVASLDSADERAACVAALHSLPPVTALVHAASPAIDAPLAALTEVNYGALRELSETVLPGMLRRQAGRIVFVGTSAIELPTVGWDHYVAAKTAAANYIRALDQRYAAFGIRATVVAPGYVLTPFSANVRPRDAVGLLAEEVAELIAAELEAADDDTGGFVWLEPDLIRRGRFGFHAGRDVGTPSESNVAPEPPTATPAAATAAGDEASGLDELVRRFFRMPAHESLSEAGLDRTPGWDSLGHLQLLLHVESKLGVAFTSDELSRTQRFVELRRLVDAKRAGR